MVKCEDMAYYMSLYLDNELSDIEKQDFESHLADCEECRKEFEEFKMLFSEVRALPEYELPQGYHDEVMMKLRKAVRPKTRFQGFSAKQFVPAAASAAGVFILLSTILNSVQLSTGMDYQPETAAESRILSAPYSMGQSEDVVEIADEAYDLGSGVSIDDNFEVYISAGQESLISNDSKESDLIGGRSFAPENDDYTYEGKYKSYYIDISVNDMEAVKQYIKDLPGSVTHEYGSVNYASITKRVSSEEFQNVVDEVENLGDASYVSSYVNDYRNIQDDLLTRIAVLSNERENLIKLMEQAENVGDIVQIQQRIYTVEEQINWRNTELEDYKNKERNPEIIINISLNIKQEEVQKSLSQKIKESFIGSINFTSRAMENIIIGIVFSIIPLIIVVLLYLVIKVNKKRFFPKKNRGDLHEKE